MLVCRRGYDPRNWYSIDYDAVERVAKTCALSPRKNKKATRQNGGQVSAKTADRQPNELADAPPAKVADADHKSPEITIETHAARVSPGDFNKRLMAYHKQHVVGRIPNGGKQGAALKQLHEDGFSPEDCEAVYDALRSEKWRNGRVDWAIVRSEIGTRLPMLHTGEDSRGDDEFGLNTPARSFATPEEFAEATGKPIDEVKANWDDTNNRPTAHAPAA